MSGWKLGHHNHHGHHHHSEGYSFQHWSPGQYIPPGALTGGNDIDGSPIYVGRAYHNGDQLPAKIVPSKSTAYVAWGGQEIAIHSCEILIQQYGNFCWMHTSGGSIPPGAIPVGRTSSGEPLYAGRVRHSGSMCVGKVHPSHGKCYIPFGGKEHPYSFYEVLVRH